jgi:predicted nuclease with TOPRIM domain
MSGPDWEYLYGELLQSTADQKGMIDYLEERRAALEAENEQLHDLACADWFRCPVPQLNEANDALKEEVERLRAWFKKLVNKMIAIDSAYGGDATEYLEEWAGLMTIVRVAVKEVGE